MQKSYKALILDVDGTIISKYNALPSTAVTTAIAKASKKLHVGLATSRPFFMLPHLIAHLNLSGPSIINGGGRIVDACTQKVLWEQPLLTTDLPKIYELANAQNLTFLINDDGQDYACTTDYKPHKPLHIWLHELSEEQADTFITKATHI
ncbi:MAG: HAD family hydrolase, partial [Candidatus Levyibacteriota bacterium]